MLAKSTIFRPLLIIAVAVLMAAPAFAQEWFAGGSNPELYDMGGDPMAPTERDDAGFVFSNVPVIHDGWGTWMIKLPPDQFRGAAIRLSAYVRGEAIEDRAGLWMQVSSPDGILAYDAMENRKISGTTPWLPYEVILDVPSDAVEIALGLRLHGVGKVWVSGLKFETADGTWELQELSEPADVLSMAAPGPNHVWLGAKRGVFFKTSDGGKNWSSGRIPGAQGADLVAMAAVDKNTAYVVARTTNTKQFGFAKIAIYKTIDGGATWSNQYVEKDFIDDDGPGSGIITLSAIAFWDAMHGIAVGDPFLGQFVILTTSDGGETWNRVPSATYPPLPPESDGYEEEIGYGTGKIAPPPQFVPSPLPGEIIGIGEAGGAALAVSGTQEVWFGTGYRTASNLPARIFRSADRGQNWTVANTPIRVTSEFQGIRALAFRDALHGIAAGETGLLQTSDGGRTWSAVGSFVAIEPRSLTYVPGSDGSTIIAAGLQGTARSNDGGASWKLLNTRSIEVMAFAGPNAGWASGPQAGAGSVSQILSFRGDMPTSVLEDEETIPQGYELEQNAPNPFNPSTKIRFSIAESVPVRLAVFDILGREVAVLVDQTLARGSYDVVFRAENLPAGMYLYRLQAGSFVQTKKLMLVK